MDPILLTNLILCVIIVVFGCVGYRKSRETLILYVTVAFGLFGLSHLLTILGLKTPLETFLIAVRTIAYLLVIYALYRVAFRR